MPERILLMQEAEQTWNNTIRQTLDEIEIMALGKIDEEFCEAIKKFRRDTQSIQTTAFMREHLNRE